jgi:DNA replication protein DnaC
VAVRQTSRHGALALVAARYERGSIILTSDKGFAEWGEVLGDAVIATAILDRLLHYSHVPNIRGESYRLKEKKRAGLFTGGPSPTGENDRVRAG